MEIIRLSKTKVTSVRVESILFNIATVGAKYLTIVTVEDELAVQFIYCKAF